MTIIKVAGEKKPDYVPPEPEIGDIPAKVPSVSVDLDGSGSDSGYPTAPVAIAVRKPGTGKRCRGLATLLLVISCGVITVGVIAGLYLWHQNYNVAQRRGYCGVTYLESAALDRQERARAKIFSENVQIHNEDLEIVDVPRLGHWKRARIIHDFAAKKTAIEDLDKKRCFVMDLDETVVKPPRSIWELIVKLRRGDYMPNEDVIRRTMKVESGPLDDLSQFGPFIANECETRDTYTLVEVAEADRILDREPREDNLEYRKKRSSEDNEDDTIGPFAGFFGNGIAQWDIVDSP